MGTKKQQVITSTRDSQFRLYKLSTNGLGDFYVVAPHPTEAEEKLTQLLESTDYGFSKDRVIVNIELITKEIVIGFNNEPHLSDEFARLIVLPKRKINYKTTN